MLDVIFCLMFDVWAKDLFLLFDTSAGSVHCVYKSLTLDIKKFDVQPKAVFWFDVWRLSFVL
jgi:hypothetical protein